MLLQKTIATLYVVQQPSFVMLRDHTTSLSSEYEYNQGLSSSVSEYVIISSTNPWQ